MKSMINIMACLILVLNLWSCKPNDQAPLPVAASTSIIWKNLISEQPESSLNSSPMYYNASVIIGKRESSGYMVKALNVENGQSLWKVFFDNTGGFNPIENESFLYEDKIVLSMGKRIYVLDASDGNLVWNYESEFMKGNSCIIDDYLYKSDIVNKNSSSLYRFDINTGAEEKLFTIDRTMYGNGYSPGLLMPVQWIHPNGDKILVLQNRTYSWFGDQEHKMDILAWNLTADSMLWYRDSVDGFSSTARPAIDGDKVFFYGDHHAYCINPLNGETIWKYFIGNGPEDDFNTANILLLEDKLIVKPDSRHMHAINKESGAHIWTNLETRAMPGLLTVRNDTIWFSSGWVLAVDANTGEKLIEWDNDGHGSWIFPVAFHPTNGNIYTSDASHLYCLNPTYMH